MEEGKVGQANFGPSSSGFHIIPGVMNPHKKVVQHWNKFFDISCLVAIFLDPLFFFLLAVQEVRFFALMDYEPILDAIRERLRRKTYIEGSEVFSAGDIIEKMVFIVRGKMVSRVDGNGIVVPLSEGDVCGEKLLTWCLGRSSINRERWLHVPAQRLVSNQTVKCLSNVEAFSLRFEDLEEVTSMFSTFLRNPRVQGAIRFESPYWRYLAATRIQIAWRYRKLRLSRAQNSQLND